MDGPRETTIATCRPWCARAKTPKDIKLQPCTFCACRACAGLCVKAAAPQAPVCLLAEQGVRERWFGSVPACSSDAASSQPIIGQPLPRRWARFGDPPPLQHSREPVTAGVLLLSEEDAPRPVYSLSYPVHDREHVVGPSLRSLLRTTAGSWEMVIVLDACTDGSEAVVWRTLSDFVAAALPGMRRDVCACVAPPSGAGCHASCPLADPRGPSRPLSIPVRILVVRAPTPLFETLSDNLAMSATSPSGYYALVQSDLVVLEVGWNQALARPLRRYPDLVGTSGRCAEDARGAVGNCVGSGVLDDREFVPAAPAASASGAGGGSSRRPRVDARGALVRGTMGGRVYVRDLAVRSPLLLRAAHAQRLGFFDEWNHFLGGDEDELCRRAWLQHGWRVAYVLVDAFDHRTRHPRLGANASVKKRWPMFLRAGTGPRCVSAAECDFLGDVLARRRRSLDLSGVPNSTAVGLGERVLASALGRAHGKTPSWADSSHDRPVEDAPTTAGTGGVHSYGADAHEDAPEPTRAPAWLWGRLWDVPGIAGCAASGIAADGDGAPSSAPPMAPPVASTQTEGLRARARAVQLTLTLGAAVASSSGASGSDWAAPPGSLGSDEAPLVTRMSSRATAELVHELGALPQAWALRACETLAR